MQAKKHLEYVADPNKFDLQTHGWDSQGRLVKKNLYRAFIIDGSTYYERPVNSGNLWFDNNQPAGRVECTFNEKGHIASKKFEFSAEHKEYTAPLAGDAKLHYQIEQSNDRIAALEAELLAIKSERTPAPVKAAPAVEAGPRETPTLKRS